jgi:hypothetical protein
VQSARSNLGAISRTYELRAVPRFTDSTIRRILVLDGHVRHAHRRPRVVYVRKYTREARASAPAICGQPSDLPITGEFSGKTTLTATAT